MTLVTSPGRGAIREWLASHVNWLIWALLVLWAPPILLTVGVDLGLVQGAGSGYLRLNDPSLLLSLTQIATMAAAVPGLARRSARSWQLLVASTIAWLGNIAWITLTRIRLGGIAPAAALDTTLALIGIGAIVVILLEIRMKFGVSDPRTRLRRRDDQLPGTTSVPANQFPPPGSLAD